MWYLILNIKLQMQRILHLFFIFNLISRSQLVCARIYCSKSNMFRPDTKPPPPPPVRFQQLPFQGVRPAKKWRKFWAERDAYANENE